MSVQAIPTAQTAVRGADFDLRSVISRDGTTIGYRWFGSGPGVVLLHGSASSGAHHVELARLLADSFTVIVPDRRGRGLSRPAGRGDATRAEVEDLAAVLEATGARNVFGLSSGAIIALQAARTTPQIRKVVAYEPPLFRDRAATESILRRFDAEMARGEIGAAMVTAMRGAEMGPAWFRALPKALTSRLVAAGMKQEAKRPRGAYPTMGELAPTLHTDFAVVTEASGPLDPFREIAADVLLMGGSKSPAFLKRALRDLAAVLPNARRVELPGLDHSASWNQDRRGHPEAVAEQLRRFFGSSTAETR